MTTPFLLAALLALPPTSSAVPLPPDTTAQAPAQTTTTLPWYRPRHLVLQTGGGLGMVAAGAGYAFWRGHADLDVLVGYVPRKYAGSTLTLAPAKLLYAPWILSVGEKWQLRPLLVGGYFSYTHGTINPGEPGQYYKGYYWFSANKRVGPLLGSRLGYALPASATGRPRYLSAYYELGSNDLYLISYAQNRQGLSPADILVLSLGVKVDF